ncbi:MAG: ornithine carbamoyltransferase [Actinomycetaceae bacterium]|nr:ornithine carbamoyltransferase [Actinomycetaceae bacterium]
MDFPLHGRSFLRELDFTFDEWTYLLDLAAQLKADRAAGKEKQYMKGLRIALVFQKMSTRTRSSFEVAAFDQGAHTTYLDPASSHVGYKESVADTARVLGRIFDAIEFRGDHQTTVEQLNKWSGVPVFNGLTDLWHPTQMLADGLTMREHAGKPLAETSYTYVGDARYNMGRSLLVSGAMLGMDVRIVAPKSLQPPHDVIEMAKARAEETGARVTVTDEVEAVAGSDFVHTDMWVSMGEPDSVWDERVELLTPYRVDANMMDMAGADAKFMHCLPAIHDRNTEVGLRVFERYGLDGCEVSDEVFSSDRSVVFDQAENRMHTIKAVMVASLGREA